MSGRPRDVVGGIVVGVAFAIVYSFVATVIYLVSAGDPNEEYPALPLLILAYFVGGVLGGGIVGWLLPYSRSRVGAIVVGIVGAIPAFAALALTLEGVSGDAVLAALISAILVGGPVGHILLYQSTSAERKG